LQRTSAEQLALNAASDFQCQLHVSIIGGPPEAGHDETGVLDSLEQVAL
jgi:hypothetical protein